MSDIKEYEITEYTEWLRDTLIADLRRSDPESCIADDLEKCVKIISQLQRDLGKHKGAIEGMLRSIRVIEGIIICSD